MTLKYNVVLGNRVQTVEWRALVEAYQVGGVAYMAVASSNTMPFKKKGRVWETVEAIVESFTLDV